MGIRLKPPPLLPEPVQQTGVKKAREIPEDDQTPEYRRAVLTRSVATGVRDALKKSGHKGHHTDYQIIISGKAFNGRTTISDRGMQVLLDYADRYELAYGEDGDYRNQNPFTQAGVDTPGHPDDIVQFIRENFMNDKDFEKYKTNATRTYWGRKKQEAADAVSPAKEDRRAKMDASFAALARAVDADDPTLITPQDRVHIEADLRSDLEDFLLELYNVSEDFMARLPAYDYDYAEKTRSPSAREYLGIDYSRGKYAKTAGAGKEHRQTQRTVSNEDIIKEYGEERGRKIAKGIETFRNNKDKEAQTRTWHELRDMVEPELTNSKYDDWSKVPENEREAVETNFYRALARAEEKMKALGLPTRPRPASEDQSVRTDGVRNLFKENGKKFAEDARVRDRIIKPQLSESDAAYVESRPEADREEARQRILGAQARGENDNVELHGMDGYPIKGSKKTVRVFDVMARMDNSGALTGLDVQNVGGANAKFKNDHEAADDVMRAVFGDGGVNIINKAGGLIGKFGGDEYVILWPNKTAAEADDVLKEVRGVIKELRVEKGVSETAYPKPINGQSGLPIGSFDFYHGTVKIERGADFATTRKMAEDIAEMKKVEDHQKVFEGVKNGTIKITEKKPAQSENSGYDNSKEREAKNGNQSKLPRNIPGKDSAAQEGNQEPVLSGTSTYGNRENPPRIPSDGSGRSGGPGVTDAEFDALYNDPGRISLDQYERLDPEQKSIFDRKRALVKSKPETPEAKPETPAEAKPPDADAPADGGSNAEASKGGYAGDATANGDGDPSGLKPVELPELVETVKAILGDVPKIYKTLPGGASGAAHRVKLPDGSWEWNGIRLSADLPKDPEQAIKTLAHEIGHVMAKFGGNGKYKALAAKINNAVETLNSPRAELKKIYGELYALSKEWRPFDEDGASPADLKYRRKGEEVFADAISVYLNDPDLLKQRAPLFWREFHAEEGRHNPTFHAVVVGDGERIVGDYPFSEVYKGLQELYGRGEEAVAEHRSQNLRGGFDAAEEAIVKGREESLAAKKISLLGWGRALYQSLVSRESPLGRLVKDVKKGGAKIDDKNNPYLNYRAQRYVKSQQTAYMLDVYNGVQDVLGKIDAETIADLNEYLTHARITSGDRGELWNPFGFDRKTSEAALAHLKKKLGGERFELLEGAARKFAELRAEHNVKKIVESGAFSKEFVDKVVNNDRYATFDVLRRISRMYGDEAVRSITGLDASPVGVHKQTGTTGPIRGPFIATLENDMKMLAFIDRNARNRNTVDLLLNHRNTLGYEAKKQRPGVGGRFDRSDNTVFVLRDGKREAYLVSPEIAALMRNPERANTVIRGTDKINNIVRDLITQKNPAFWVWNFQRDFRTFHRNVPGWVGRKVMALAKAYPEVWRYVTAGEMSDDIKSALQERAMLPSSVYSKDNFFDVDSEFYGQLAKFTTVEKKAGYSRST